MYSYKPLLMMITLLSKETSAKQKLDLQAILRTYKWHIRFDVSSVISLDDENVGRLRRIWGDYSEKSFNYRSKTTKNFIKDSFVRLDPKLRIRNYPLLFVHEFIERDGLTVPYSGHTHCVLLNMTKYDHDEVMGAMKTEGRLLRRTKALDVYIQPANQERGISDYIAKFSQHSKDVDYNWGIKQLIKRDSNIIRNSKIAIKEEAQELYEKELSVLKEKHDRVSPWMNFEV
jgi:hypothetical protein